MPGQGASPGGLTPTELVERLRIGNEEIVRDLYALTIRQLDSEDKRESNLNSKAVSLLTASGVSVTVTFALGGLLAQRAELLALLGPPWGFFRFVVGLAYLAAGAAGLVGGFFALSALKVSEHRTASEKDVFGGELASVANELPAVAANRYRRFLVAHLWQVYRFNFGKHDSKANLILKGQKSYMAFLGLLVPLALAMAYFLGSVPAPSQPVTAFQGIPMAQKEEQKPAAPQQAASPTPAKPPPTTVPSTGEQVKNNVPPQGTPTSPANAGGRE